MGSSVITEGYTLKNIQMMIIQSPKWNYPTQALGRVLRIKTHDNLITPENPIIKIQIYFLCAVPKEDTHGLLKHIETGEVLSYHEYVYLTALIKDINIKKIEKILHLSSIDCNLNSNRHNFISEEKLISRNNYYSLNPLVCYKNSNNLPIEYDTYLNYDSYYVEDYTEKLLNLLLKDKFIYFQSLYSDSLEEYKYNETIFNIQTNMELIYKNVNIYPYFYVNELGIGLTDINTNKDILKVQKPFIEYISELANKNINISKNMDIEQMVDFLKEIRIDNLVIEIVEQAIKRYYILGIKDIPNINTIIEIFSSSILTDNTDYYITLNKFKMYRNENWVIDDKNVTLYRLIFEKYKNFTEHYCCYSVLKNEYYLRKINSTSKRLFSTVDDDILYSIIQEIIKYDKEYMTTPTKNKKSKCDIVLKWYKNNNLVMNIL